MLWWGKSGEKSSLFLPRLVSKYKANGTPQTPIQIKKSQFTTMKTKQEHVVIDLSHWDFVNDFSPEEAAYLILGVDPSNDNSGRNARHICRRMSQDYESELENLRFYFFTEPCLPDGWVDDGPEKTDPKSTLKSVEVEKLFEMYHLQDDEVSITTWLDRGSNQFWQQRFSRTELGRWLADNQLPSGYQFAPVSSAKLNGKTDKSDLDRPLGNRERRTLLSIIAALCKEAKINFLAHSKAAGLIESTAIGMGIEIGQSTIESHLKKIPDALETHMK